jgi:hypothetical protein
LAVWVSFHATSGGAELLVPAGGHLPGWLSDQVRSLAGLVDQRRPTSTESRGRLTFADLDGQDGSEIKWWMTFNRDTYMHDLLALMVENVFAKRAALPAGGRPGLGPSQRHLDGTCVTPGHLCGNRCNPAGPILLPSEPYAFRDEDQTVFEELLPGVEVKQVDGSLLT